MANRTKLTPKKRKTFLAALEYNGNVTEASKAAGITRACAYVWRDKHPDFAEEWENAYQTATDRLESEAWERATNGTSKPVYQNGQLVGHIQQYSDTLLIFLLKGHKPDRFKERSQIEVTKKPEIDDAKDRLAEMFDGAAIPSTE